MNRKITIGECSLGRGVFARCPVRQGEVLFFLSGKFVNAEQSELLQDRGANTIGIGRGQYIDPGYPSVFINHSCDPNAGIVDDLTFVALRPIAVGQEIRFDYSTALMERNWTMECCCGSPACRGLVKDFDLLPTPVQQRYLHLGIVQSYIVSALGTLTSTAAA